MCSGNACAFSREGVNPYQAPRHWRARTGTERGMEMSPGCCCLPGCSRHSVQEDVLSFTPLLFLPVMSVPDVCFVTRMCKNTWNLNCGNRFTNIFYRVSMLTVHLMERMWKKISPSAAVVSWMNSPAFQYWSPSNIGQQSNSAIPVLLCQKMILSDAARSSSVQQLSINIVPRLNVQPQRGKLDQVSS